jgi:SAM-dependent methyltransferase
VRYSAHLTLTDCLSKTTADAIPRREEGKGDSATLASLLHRDRQGHMLRTFSKRLPVRRLQELSAISPVDCPICDGASKLDAPHPEVDLLRCTVCGHRFSRIKDGSSWERYDPLYYQETHRNWFAYPDLGLFDTIARRIENEPEPRSLIDVGCGNGNLLRHLAKRFGPNTEFVGIDLSLNETTPGIEFIQGDVLNTPFDKTFSVVVTLATIEHIADICSFAERLRSLTKPGGLVVVMTLNDDSLLYVTARTLRRLGIPIAFDRLYSRHHLHHFGRASLCHLLRDKGLRPEYAVVHNAPFRAIDVPAKSPVAAAFLRLAVVGINCFGWLTGKSYLQTVFCRYDRGT